MASLLMSRQHQWRFDSPRVNVFSFFEVDLVRPVVLMDVNMKLTVIRSMTERMRS